MHRLSPPAGEADDVFGRTEPHARRHRRCTSASAGTRDRGAGGTGTGATSRGGGTPTAGGRDRPRDGDSRWPGHAVCSARPAQEAGRGHATKIPTAWTILPPPWWLPPSPGGFATGTSFPIFRQQTYLNSCSLGALSLQSRARVTEYLDLWEARGASAWYDTWLPALDQLRAGYASVIGAGAERDLASSLDFLGARGGGGVAGLREPAAGGDDQPGFSDGGLPMARQGDRRVSRWWWSSARTASRSRSRSCDRQIDARTALVATSHVFFTTGQSRMSLRWLSCVTRRGARLLVDGYQAAGQLPVDVKALGVDFYCCGRTQVAARRIWHRLSLCATPIGPPIWSPE